MNSGRILEGQRTRDVRCGDFAHALSDHDVGPHTRLTERGRESHLKRKEERLDVIDALRLGCGTRHRPFEGSTSRLGFGIAVSDSRAIDAPRDWRAAGRAPSRATAIPAPETRKQDAEPRAPPLFFPRATPRVHLDRRDRFELPRERLRSIGKSERRAMVVVRAPTLRRVAQVAHRERFVARELRPEGLRHERNSLLAGSRNRKNIRSQRRRAAHLGLRLFLRERRRLLDDGVSVSAADPEGADPPMHRPIGRHGVKDTGTYPFISESDALGFSTRKCKCAGIARC